MKYAVCRSTTATCTPAEENKTALPAASGAFGLTSRCVGGLFFPIFRSIAPCPGNPGGNRNLSPMLIPVVSMNLSSPLAKSTTCGIVREKTVLPVTLKISVCNSRHNVVQMKQYLSQINAVLEALEQLEHDLRGWNQVFDPQDM